MAAPTPFGKIAGTALSTRHFTLLFAAMLVAAAGNTALQSVMPAIGRAIGIGDVWIALAYTSSAAFWVWFAPQWARLSDHRGRKPLILLGIGGFIISTLLCGLVLLAGLKGTLGIVATVAGFAFFRIIYGILGCATPSATQAYLASRTRRSSRVKALSTLSSSFGLGTIIGPALAPLFVLPFFGLTGPMFVFAGVAIIVFAAIRIGLPDDRQDVGDGHGAAMSYPSLASFITGASVIAATSERAAEPIRWTDPRIRNWILAGVLTNHAMAAILTCVGFFTIDELVLNPIGAEEEIALVMMAGAAATLGAQWGLIPRLDLKPKALILLGSAIAALGLLMTMGATTLYGIILGFGITNLGFGLTRPGFTGGASLAVPLKEQGGVAGIITSANGIAWVAAPTLGILAYGFDPHLPFIAGAALLAGVIIWGWRRL